MSKIDNFLNNLPDRPAPPKSALHQKRVLIVIICITVIIASLLGLLLLFKSKSKSANEQTSTALSKTTFTAPAGFVDRKIIQIGEYFYAFDRAEVGKISRLLPITSMDGKAPGVTKEIIQEAKSYLKEKYGIEAGEVGAGPRLETKATTSEIRQELASTAVKDVERTAAKEAVESGSTTVTQLGSEITPEIAGKNPTINNLMNIKTPEGETTEQVFGVMKGMAENGEGSYGNIVGNVNNPLIPEGKDSVRNINLYRVGDTSSLSLEEAADKVLSERPGLRTLVDAGGGFTQGLIDKGLPEGASFSKSTPWLYYDVAGAGRESGAYRVYMNLNDEHTAQAFQGLIEELNANQKLVEKGFQMKTTNFDNPSKADFTQLVESRKDSIVMYFGKDGVDEALPIIQKFAESHPEMFTKENPYFTQALYDSQGNPIRGVGVATEAKWEVPQEAMDRFGRYSSSTQFAELGHQMESYNTLQRDIVNSTVGTIIDGVKDPQKLAQIAEKYPVMYENLSKLPEKASVQDYLNAILADPKGEEFLRKNIDTIYPYWADKFGMSKDNIAFTKEAVATAAESAAKVAAEETAAKTPSYNGLMAGIGMLTDEVYSGDKPGLTASGALEKVVDTVADTPGKMAGIVAGLVSPLATGDFFVTPFVVEQGVKNAVDGTMPGNSNYYKTTPNNSSMYNQYMRNINDIGELDKQIAQANSDLISKGQIPINDENYQQLLKDKDALIKENQQLGLYIRNPIDEGAYLKQAQESQRALMEKEGLSQTGIGSEIDFATKLGQKVQEADQAREALDKYNSTGEWGTMWQRLTDFTGSKEENWVQEQVAKEYGAEAMALKQAQEEQRKELGIPIVEEDKDFNNAIIQGQASQLIQLRGDKAQEALEKYYATGDWGTLKEKVLPEFLGGKTAEQWEQEQLAKVSAKYEDTLKQYNQGKIGEGQLQEAFENYQNAVTANTQVAKARSELEQAGEDYANKKISQTDLDDASKRYQETVAEYAKQQTGQFSSLNELMQKEKDSALPDTTQVSGADRGADARVNAGGRREEAPPGASMLYWGTMGPAEDEKRLPFQLPSPETTSAAPNNSPPIPQPQGVQSEPPPSQPIAGANNFSKGNGSEGQPFELTEEAIAKIYEYDRDKNEIRLRDDWEDRLGRKGTGSWVKGVDTQKITDALVKSGDMLEDEQTKFMEKSDHESIKASDNTETRNTESGQKSSNDQDDKPDIIKKPGKTLFKT